MGVKTLMSIINKIQIFLMVEILLSIKFHYLKYRIHTVDLFLRTANIRFQWIETADAFSKFCGMVVVLCSNHVCPMRFQPLKRALDRT